jgi:hypothetical protein
MENSDYRARTSRTIHPPSHTVARRGKGARFLSLQVDRKPLAIASLGLSQAVSPIPRNL